MSTKTEVVREMPSLITLGEAIKIKPEKRPASLKKDKCRCGAEEQLFLMEFYIDPSSDQPESFVYVCAECEEQFWNSCETISYRRAA